MSMSFSGQCACGATRYECAAEPLAMYNCHCQACQRAGGAPFAAILVVPSDAVTIAGSPSQYSAAAADGSEHAHGLFCGICGTPLFARSDARPDVFLIRAPTLADTSWFKPVADIWTASALPWVSMDSHIPKVHKSPPLLQKQAAPSE